MCDLFLPYDSENQYCEDTEQDEIFTKLDKLQQLRLTMLLDMLKLKDCTKKMHTDYELLCLELAEMPQASDILLTPMPKRDKLHLLEKLAILSKLPAFSQETNQIRKHIMDSIDSYKLTKLSKKEIEQYEILENELLNTIPKPLKYQILDLNLSKESKAFILSRYHHLMSLDITASNGEYNKLQQWLYSIVNIPTANKTLEVTNKDTTLKINKYLWKVKSVLDEEVYGMNKVKEQILFILNNRITSGKNTGAGFALCGPPGTAKTSIIRAMAKAIDLPFVQINLGGAKDVSFLSGHNYTYEGATSGAIVQAIQSMGCKNGIIYFDELDKVSNTSHGTEISRLLLHITDTSQNDKFIDRYLTEAVPIDLSNIWFIYSLNNLNELDKTLADRIPILMVEGYSKKEKQCIAKNYLIPRIMTSLCLKHVIITDAAIEQIVDLCTEHHKSGVRKLNHVLTHLFTKINFLKTLYKAKKYKIELDSCKIPFQIPFEINCTILKSFQLDKLIIQDTFIPSMYS